jgi:hypothetical protein
MIIEGSVGAGEKIIIRSLPSAASFGKYARTMESIEEGYFTKEFRAMIVGLPQSKELVR